MRWVQTPLTTRPTNPNFSLATFADFSLQLPRLALKFGPALLGLTTLAIALPLLTTLANGPTFFIAHRAGNADIVGFALLVYLLPPALLILMVLLSGVVHRGLATWMGHLLVTLTAALWLLGLLPPMPSWIALGIATATGAIIALLLHHKPGVSSFLRVVALISLLGLLVFLLLSPLKKLFFSDADIASGSVGDSQTPVVMLVLDELSSAAISRPDGEIDSLRLPNFGRLRALSTWYSNTTTASTQTQRAVPALLSGLRVDQQTLPIVNEFPQNLFTLLSVSHRVTALETGTRLCPETICNNPDGQLTDNFSPLALYADAAIVYLHTVLPLNLAARWLPPVSQSWRGFGQQLVADSTAAPDAKQVFGAMIFDLATNTSRRFEQFLQPLSNQGGVNFNYFHLALPHTPWMYLPDGQVYNGRFVAGESTTTYAWLDNQYLADQGLLRYALQLEYVDHLLGRVLDTLTASGRFDDTLLIVVSDHGVSFVAGQQRRIPIGATLADVALVPLFIKYPGQRTGVRDHRPVQTIDVFHTVADVLGLPLHSPVDGQSLVSRRWIPPPQRYLFETPEEIDDFEAALDPDLAIQRFSTVIPPGHSALQAIGAAVGGQYRGRPLADLRISAPTGPLTLHLDRPEWFTKVAPASGFVPALLNGSIPGAAAATEVLFALNGTIAGSGRTWGDDGRFSLLLDPRRFVAGFNTLTALLLKNGKLHLLPRDAQAGGWQLDFSEQGEIVTVIHAGHRWHAAAGLQGSSSHSIGNPAVATHSGWAYDGQNRSAAQELLLLDGNEVVSTGFTQQANPFIARQQQLPADLPIGFYIELGPDLRSRANKLSVLALFENGRFLHVPTR